MCEKSLLESQHQSVFFLDLITADELPTSQLSARKGWRIVQKTPLFARNLLSAGTQHVCLRAGERENKI